MRNLWRTLAVAVLIANAAIAAAQIPTSSSEVVTTPGKQADRRLLESDTALRATIRCSLDRTRTRAKLALATTPGGKDEARILRAYQSFMDWCLQGTSGGGISADWQLMRGIFAEELYKREFGERPVTPNADSEQAAQRAAAVPVSGGNAERMSLAGSARCVVARRPAVVGELVVSDPFGDGERRAFGKLRESLAACIDQGTNATFSRQMLRGYLSEAYYHYSVAVKVGFRPINATVAPRKQQ